jgi:RNA polymerase sigma factor (sigma-70 family)
MNTSELFNKAAALEVIYEVLDNLPNRDRLVISHLYGIDDKALLSQSELAEIQGCSRQRIHIIKKRAEGRIKNLFTNINK